MACVLESVPVNGSPNPHGCQEDCVPPDPTPTTIEEAPGDGVPPDPTSNAEKTTAEGVAPDPTSNAEEEEEEEDGKKRFFRNRDSIGRLICALAKAGYYELRIKNRNYWLEHASSALCQIYLVESKGVVMNDRDKSIVGPLIYEALDSFGSWLISSENEMGLDYFQQERSGIQFMLDRYRDFPINEGSKTLAEAFDYFVQYEDLEEFDRAYERHPNYDPCEIPEGVPQTHWWWEKANFYDPIY